METSRHFGVTEICLSHFRSHTLFRWAGELSQKICVTGPNGAGKTNILEALSLLAPGRGLRRASFKDIQAQGACDAWRIRITLETPDGQNHISMDGTGASGRHVCIDGTPLKRQLDLQDYCHVLWMTPATDLLFGESMGARRRFLDRLLTTYDKSYAPLLLTYERTLKQWRSLLDTPEPHPSWLEGLESILADRGTQVCTKRIEFVTQLAKNHEKRNDPLFFDIQLEGDAERAIQKDAATARAAFLNHLFKVRNAHSKFKPLTFGPQATKINISAYNKPIEYCSTGQQKRAVFALILSACHLQLERFSQTPCLLLLDDLAAHLDAQTLTQLLSSLKHPNLQTWTTGTQPHSGADATSVFIKL